MHTSYVTIQFPSVNELWEFRKAINCDVFQMNLRLFTISCDCTKAQIGLAIEQYRGTVVSVNEKAGA